MKKNHAILLGWLSRAAILSVMMLPSFASAGGMNPCGANPCSASNNPCAASMNPCAAHSNPCGEGSNPCGAAMNNPCGGNPCAASENTPIREHAFNTFDEAVALGKKLWSNESLGTSGVACLSCHADNELLNFDKKEAFPHFVKMVGDVVSLDQMINYCMINPMKGKAFKKNSKEQTAMAAYYRSYRETYLRTHP